MKDAEEENRYRKVEIELELIDVKMTTSSE